MKKFLLKLISFAAIASIVLGCVSFSSFAALKGDVDGNGSVNSADALIVLQYSVGIEIDESIDTALLDVNGDASINAADALIVLQISVGIVDNEEDEPEVPTKAELIDEYNKAVNKVVDEKAGYKKQRVSELGKLEGAEALMKMSAAREAVYEFLNIGETNKTNAKGTSKYFLNASLTEADVKALTYVKKDGVCTLTILLFDGKCTAPVKTETSPIVRSGIVCGNEAMNADYDYKNAANIYDAISSASGASVNSVTGQVNNAEIVVEIDEATGRMMSFSMNWDASVKMDTLKYSVIKINATGSMTTSITLSDFDW